MGPIFLALLVCLHLSSAKEINNTLLGQYPEVACLEDEIQITFLTRNPFRGRIYVVGHHATDECLSRADSEPYRRTASIIIGTRPNLCGVTKLRTANPRGLYVKTKVRVSFHNLFVTKADRGYDITCFFKDHEKTGNYPLTVNANRTPIPFTQKADPPNCEYRVIEQSTGDLAAVVPVGTPLTHEWECRSESPDLWCMLVHSCHVQDDRGTEVQVIDAEGCAKDQFLLGNPMYTQNGRLMRATRDAHAFKYADSVAVNFECSIQLALRGLDANGRKKECQRPQCSKRLRRSTTDNENSSVTEVTEVDVVSQEMEVLESLQTENDRPTKTRGRHTITPWRRVFGSNHRYNNGADCVPRDVFAGALLAACGLALLITAFLVRQRLTNN